MPRASAVGAVVVGIGFAALACTPFDAEGQPPQPFASDAAVPSPDAASTDAGSLCNGAMLLLCDDFDNRTSPSDVKGKTWGLEGTLGEITIAPASAARSSPHVSIRAPPEASDYDALSLVGSVPLVGRATFTVRFRAKVPTDLVYIRIAEFIVDGAFSAIVVENGMLVAQVPTTYAPTVTRAPADWATYTFEVTFAGTARLLVDDVPIWTGASNIEPSRRDLKVGIGPRFAKSAIGRRVTVAYDDVVIE